MVFLVQAINISGGINPSKVSYTKKNEKTPSLENVSVIDSNSSLILKTYLLTKKRRIKIHETGIKVFLTLSQINM